MRRRHPPNHAIRSSARGRQYTIRGVSSAVDRMLRTRARSEGKSLNTVLLEALERELSLAADAPARRDLSDVIGGPFDLEAFEIVRAAHEQIDENLWK